MSGWIKLYRDIDSHWIFNFKEPDKALAWINLLTMANHVDNDFYIKGRIVKCKRGQVAMSQLNLQKKWNMSQNKLKRFLVLLKKESMIDFETNDLTTIITICNYSTYQCDERPLERPLERTTNDHSNDKQECNNEKNEKKEKKEKKEKSTRAMIPFFETVELPFFIDRELFIGWQRERKKQHPKAAQTEFAINRHIAELSELEMSGYPANSCLVIIRAGIWQGVNKQVCIDKMSNNGQSNSNKSFQQQEREHSQRIQDAINSMDF